MALSRYKFVDGIEVDVSNEIYKSAQAGIISVKYVLSEGQKRLDHYAYEEYGDGMNWWVIAAASGIGWWMQCPPGTLLIIPTDISEIERLL